MARDSEAARVRRLDPELVEHIAQSRAVWFDKLDSRSIAREYSEARERPRTPRAQRTDVAREYPEPPTLEEFLGFE